MKLRNRFSHDICEPALILLVFDPHPDNEEAPDEVPTLEYDSLTELLGQWEEVK